MSGDRLAEANAENERKRRECPNRAAHMATPDQSRFYHQAACPGCGLFLMWTPKNKLSITSHNLAADLGGGS